MKKSIIAVLLALLLMLISISTINKYNASKSKNNQPTENSTTKNNPTEAVPNTDADNKTNSIDTNHLKTKATDFNLTDLTGNRVSLSDLKGKKVFLNFWATWCPPCKAEMPEIERLYQETKSSHLVIVAVNIGESSGTVSSFAKSHNYNFKILLDYDQSVAAKYNISSIPASYFIDADGNIVSQHIGAMDINQMKEYINALGK
ncbi:redoxin domain-containing protein [Inconstantimicrobium mannanitabidum]|uniref:Uncharacterized protein n=1 Tax=Inconstantimicrobium mannanitabidum TaxID=1604901 RepID=A0ACB5R9S0_9CLOT|nr:redoxin domain-containing protein [Clostridium sp. TW13]GKX65780.1 hypothetical protein rsdtw13_10380 [Clostridium sp. TW13]